MTTRTWAPAWVKAKARLAVPEGPSVSPIQPPSSMRTGKPVKRMTRAACLKDSAAFLMGFSGRDARRPRPPMSCFMIASSW
ncbi:unknown [Clostridium sp. CAG:58]|nr:unknown [Clostridium sp. CAG:58]